MELTLSYDSFTTLPYTTGTVQNVSEKAVIEVGTTDTQNAGLELHPGEKYEFRNQTVYARAKWDSGEVVQCVVDELTGGSGSGGSGVAELDITVPTTGWTDSDSGTYSKACTISVSGVTSDMVPDIVFSIDYLDALTACGFATTCESINGGIVVYAQSVPASAIPAKLQLTTIS